MGLALQATTIEGIATNLSLLRSVVGDPRYVDGRLTTTFLEDNLSALLEKSAVVS